VEVLCETDPATQPITFQILNPQLAAAVQGNWNPGRLKSLEGVLLRFIFGGHP
jgi:hypothetical protein